MTSPGSTAPTRADVEAAARRIRGVAFHTPLVRSDWLSDVAHADVWLKLEAHADHGIVQDSRRGERDRRDRRGTAARAPDHDGVGRQPWPGGRLRRQARRAGRARSTCRRRRRRSNETPCVRLGAEIIETATYDEAEARAQAEGARDDTAFVSAYSDHDVIAGAGTVALEMFEDVPELDTIIAPIGGGGLLSGIAIVARVARPADARRRRGGRGVAGLHLGARGRARRRPSTVRDTLADGLAGNMEPDSQTFDIVRVSSIASCWSPSRRSRGRCAS